MRAILVVLCAAILCASGDKPKPRGFYRFTRVPHDDPEYRAIVIKALKEMGQSTYDVKVISLYEKFQAKGYEYKLTYKRYDDKICFMRWSVSAVLGIIDATPPSCR